MDRRDFLRGFLRILNRFVVVPAFRHGLGWLISNPIAGDIMVLRIRGKRTGRAFFVPVSFARIGGLIYCYQGRETRGVWLYSILANPEVLVLLPHERLTGRARLVEDASLRLAALRALLRSSGIFGSMYGFDPSKASDDLVLERMRGVSVIAISPDGGL